MQRPRLGFGLRPRSRGEDVGARHIRTCPLARTAGGPHGHQHAVSSSKPRQHISRRDMLLGAMLAHVGARSAAAQGQAPAASNLDSVPPVAQRLWNDLVCLCGCNRLTLASCQCDDAERERKNILALLDHRDLKTTADQQAAYEDVIGIYKSRYGKRVLTTENDADGHGRWWLAPAVMVVVIVVGYIFLLQWGKKPATAQPARRDHEPRRTSKRKRRG